MMTEKKKAQTGKNEIKKMFNLVSSNYDVLNSLLSFRIHNWWKKRTISIFKGHWQQATKQIMLDLCSGTLDLSLQMLKKSNPNTLVISVDFSHDMLLEGKKKINKIKEEQRSRLCLICADIEHLPLRSNIADGVVIGFGLRNVVNRHQGLLEMKRVLRPLSRLAVLEFSQPKSRIFRAFYHFHFLRILPWLGGLVSGNTEAYQYLTDSVLKFYTPWQLKELMLEAGFQNVDFSLLSGGIAALHVGEKKYGR